MTLQNWLLWFMFYSVLGWCYESLLCSAIQRAFVNRGFLRGPYCPIYGFGAVLDLLVLRGIDHPAMLFLAGAALACALEYVVSWGMERQFKARWWDYSDRLLNLNGRICLLGMVAFGAFAVLLVKGIHPVIIAYTDRLPPKATLYISAALFAFLLQDTICTVLPYLFRDERARALSTQASALAASVLQAADRIPGMRLFWRDRVTPPRNATRKREIPRALSAFIERMRSRSRKP